MSGHKVLTIILGGGRGTRLFPLTKDRAKPAVPLGGSYRLIDIPVSNCIHSNLHRIFVLTQFNSASLNQHLSRTYRFDAFRQGFVEVLAASLTDDTDSWYSGTADAVRRNLLHFSEFTFEDYLILAGDHLYAMDYEKFHAFHREKKADITIAVTPVTKTQASGLGLVQIDRKNRVTGFAEKPKDLSSLKGFEWNGTPPVKKGQSRFLASMGIYVFRRNVLDEALGDPANDDFGRDMLPKAVEKGLKVYAFPFTGYWRDIGTIKSFYEANLQMTGPAAPFSFHRGGLPIFSRSRYLPGAKIMASHVDRAIVSAGSLLQSCDIADSIVGLRSVLREGTQLRKTVLMGADYFETDAALRQTRRKKMPPLGIGRNCHIEGAIIDKNARIGNGVRISNDGKTRNADGEGYVIRDGIVIVPKNTIIPDGTVI